MSWTSPGASLPCVETHFMEHGLLFLNGGGVYRLDDCRFPVAMTRSGWIRAARNGSARSAGRTRGI